MQIGNIDFADLVKRSWEHAWKNKGLWVLGWLVIFLGGARFDLNSSFSNQSSGSGGGGPTNPQITRFLREVQLFWEQNQTLILGGVVVLVLASIVLGLFLMALGMVARGGLLRSPRLAQAHGGTVSLGEAIDAGRDTLGRQLSLWVITDLPFGVLNLLTTLGVLAYLWQAWVSGRFDLREMNVEMFLKVFGPVMFCLVPWGVVLGLASWLAQIFNHMGALATTLEEDPTGFAALQRGAQVLLANFVPFFLLALVLSLVQGMVGFVIGLPLLFAFVPLMIGGMWATISGNMASIMAVAVIGGLCLLALTPVGMMVSGLFNTVVYTLWANLYTIVTAPPTRAPNPDYARPL